MVVAAAASLDGTRTVQDCRIQSKAPTISDVVISDLVKVSLCHRRKVYLLTL
jgi:hypothetical protein